MYMKHFIPLIMAMSCCAVYAQERVDTLREVVVTGTGTQHLLKNAPVQTEVISRKMLDSYGAKSIEDILGGLTASFAFNEGDMGSQMQLGGLGNNYILILIDGKRIHGDNGGENDLGLIDPHNIERIEVVKGAQSALYGSDAMAGVINIITKKHNEHGVMVENSTRGESGGGLDFDLRQHNSIGLNFGKIQSYTNFQLQKSSGWQNSSDEYTQGHLVNDTKNMTTNKFRNWQIGERLSYKPVKALELYAEGTFYIKDIMRPQKGNYPSCDTYTYDLMYRNISISGGGKLQLGKTDYITLDYDWNKHAYYYNYFHTTFEEIYYEGELIEHFPLLPGQHRLQSNQQRQMANLKGVFHLPADNLLSAGAEYRYDYLQAPMRVTGGNADDWTASVYLQDEFSKLEWLNLTGGIRLVKNQSFGYHATPKLSAMVSLGDFRIRAGWSQGFKSPTIKELNYQYLRHMGSNTYLYMGNRDLRPQTSNYWSLNGEYRGNHFTASVTGYINRLNNMITLVNVPVSEIPVGTTSEFMGDGSGMLIPRMYKNMENAKTYGIDVNVTYNINKEWAVGGNYSYLNTDAQVYNDAKNRLDDVTIDGMAHHKWNAFATWQHQFTDCYRLSAGLHTRGSSKRFYQDNGDGDGFQIWRLTTTHEFASKQKLSYRLELGVDNVFNYVDRTPRPYHLGTTAHGRSVYATLNIRFLQGKKTTTKLTNKKTYNEED